MYGAEYQVEFAQQVAFISALLGGFAFSVATSIVSRDDTTRLTGFLVGVMSIAIAALLLSTFFSAFVAVEAKLRPEVVGKRAYEYVAMITMPSFFIGILAFLVGLGLLGWIRSRAMGIVTSVVAASAGILLLTGIINLASLGR
jgi:uncharacterized membrane protein YkgB